LCHPRGNDRFEYISDFYDFIENDILQNFGNVRFGSVMVEIKPGVKSTTTCEAVGLNFLPAAIAAGKKRQKHGCAAMLNLQ
jgi:hypothetical protein